MSTAQIIQTIIEIVLGVLFIVGFWKEDKLAEWEEKLFKKIKGRVKNEKTHL